MHGIDRIIWSLHTDTAEIHETDDESVRYYENRYEGYREIENNILKLFIFSY